MKKYRILAMPAGEPAYFDSAAYTRLAAIDGYKMRVAWAKKSGSRTVFAVVKASMPISEATRRVRAMQSLAK